MTTQRKIFVWRQDHVVIMTKKWGLIPKILSGHKTLESRWYLHKALPWDKIEVGDTVYFKNAGEAIIARAEVSGVEQFENLTAEKVASLLIKYGKNDGLGIESGEFDFYYERFKQKKYCLIIHLKNAETIEPFQIDKSGFGAMSAWITVANINKIKINISGGKMSKFVELKFTDQVLRINSRGGGIAEYYIETAGKRHDVIYGYAVEKDADGDMGDILAPFPGRVDGGEYDFESKHYKISGFELNNGNPLHVFVRELTWQIEKTGDNQMTSSLEVKAAKFDANGYPFSLDLKIIYTLSDRGLTVETRVKNTGKKAAPFGVGYHPYFKVAVEVDEMVWQVPAKKVVEFDDRLKPTGKLIPISKTHLDFRKAHAIEGIEVDNCFTDLMRDKDGIFTSTLCNLNGTREIKIWQDKSYPYFQTYSSDTIADRNYRKAMALEPQSCCGYAVNVPDLGLISLKPGGEFKGKWGVNFKFI